jgi:hypothetical protein
MPVTLLSVAGAAEVLHLSTGSVTSEALQLRTKPYRKLHFAVLLLTGFEVVIELVVWIQLKCP